jgi:hypothetical protein
MARQTVMILNARFCAIKGLIPMSRLLSFAALLVVLLSPRLSYAQLAGHNTKGDFGLQSGTQAPPGLYVVPLYLDYSADTLRDNDGDRLAPLGGGGSINAQALIAGLLWVSDKKILGGNYGFSVYPGVTNNALELPALQMDSKTSTGLADIYVQPIILGWNAERADYTAGIGIYAPTGEYTAGGDSNRGLGMWSYELFGGTTVYFDKAKTWHFAATAFYETHGKKDGTDVRVGDILTIEGGLGKSFKEGAINVGLAYYAQWKLTNDDFGLGLVPPGGPIFEKHRVYGFGPEVSLPLASKTKLFGFLNLRYFWETGARTTLEGNTFLATFTFPVPSISLQ